MKRKLFFWISAFMAGLFFSENNFGIAIIAILFILCKITFYLSKKIKNKKMEEKTLFIFVIFFIFGIVFFRFFNFSRYEEIKTFHNSQKIVTGVVANEGENKDGYWEYILKNNNIDGKKLKSNILIKTKKKLEYGNKIKATLDMTLPRGASNKNTFDYAKHLKTLNIYIIGDVKDIVIISKNNLTFIEFISFFIRNKVRLFTNENLNEVNSKILNALIIGDEAEIKEDLTEDYKKSGMLHLLVVSGGHTVFLIMLLKFIFSFFNISKIISKLIYIVVIFMYIFITGATPSILRAGIGIIIIIIAELIGRENDSFTTIGVVAFLLLINNPNMLFSLSFLLSFGGVIGIILCYPKINELFKFMPNFIRESLALTISAQLFVTPITIYSFNTIYLGGIVSNILTLNLSGIIMMSGIILFLFYLLIPPVVIFPMKIVSFFISVMNKIAEIFSDIDFFVQYIITPNMISIILYYMLLVYIFCERDKYSKKSLAVIRVPHIPLVILKNRKIIIVFCIIISILILNIKIIDIDKSLKVSMIDVGHGDSILITTPNDKHILIDTGDKYFKGEKAFDSGEKTIIPYLLKQGIKNIDLLILTHMDSDHIGGYESIANVIKINTLGLSVNSGKKEEYKKIRDVAINKKINIKSLGRGDRFIIDKVKFNILMPNVKNEIYEENNDSIILLMEYKNRKMLFMGDLENEGEKVLLSLEKDLDIDVLKVGHHGSITSSSEEFIRATKPEIALISVGNRFNSIPSSEVINRFSSIHSKVYRTDKMGEINVFLDDTDLYVETTY